MDAMDSGAAEEESLSQWREITSMRANLDLPLTTRTRLRGAERGLSARAEEGHGNRAQISIRGQAARRRGETGRVPVARAIAHARRSLARDNR